jgi:hypothetical protein
LYESHTSCIWGFLFGGEVELGKICSKCGDCCKAIPCGIGFAIFGDHRPCAALEKYGDKYACGLVLHPSKYIELGEEAPWKDEWFSKMVGGMLGIGLGCCSSKEGERLSLELRERMKKFKYKPISEKGLK